jgi:hypothetical protein
MQGSGVNTRSLLFLANSSQPKNDGKMAAMKIESHSELESGRAGERESGRKALRLIVCFMLCLINPLAFAQTQTETQDPAPAQDSQPEKPSNWNWSFSIRNRTGFRTNEPHQLQMSRTIFDAKGIYKINDNWRMTLEGRAHYDPVERLGYPKNVWLDPRQVLLDGRAGKVDLKLGLQQVVWGQSDGLRVLDVINPLDYREFILEDFIDSRRPLWLARADAPVGQGSLQLIWVPYFAPARLPAADNEFGLGESFGLGLIDATLREQGLPKIPFRVEATDRPAYHLKLSQFGARYSRSISAWDLTANYFYGWEGEDLALDQRAILPVVHFRAATEAALSALHPSGFDLLSRELYARDAQAGVVCFNRIESEPIPDPPTNHEDHRRSLERGRGRGFFWREADQYLRLFRFARPGGD